MLSFAWLGGVSLCVLLAAAAMLAGASSGLPAMLLALVGGIAIRALAPPVAARFQPGIGFCAKRLLRIGVALLGLKIVAADLIALGGPALLLVVVSLVVTLTGGIALAWVAGQPRDLGAISATSVAVCGASAALAASTTVPPREHLEEETALIIVVVSLLSTVVMVLYPPLAEMLGVDARVTAILLGAAIHDVAQVAGAGFSVSEAVGTHAIAIKMIRVACLLPVVIALGIAFARPRGGDSGDKGAGKRAPLLPAFLVAFSLLAILASAGVVPAAVADFGGQAANWALAASVAALGLKTSLAEMKRADPALIAVIAGQTLLQLAAVIALIHLLFG